MLLSRNRRAAFHLALLVVAIFAIRPILSQATTATILGVVKDDSGAILPGVSVTIRHLDTGTSRALVSDDAGRYHAPNLALGDYEIQAELGGFQTAVRSGIKLSLGQEAVVDFTMKVGELTEKIVVSGEAPLVQTTSSTLTALVDDKKIRDLPLNGRDFSQLVTMQAGVYSPPSMGQTITGTFGSGPRISISGARPVQNNFLLDGSDVQDSQGRTPAGVSGTTLGVETVREFTVLTSTYSAEYGKVAGGVINAVTKSGTNDLHGSVFEFHRNDNLDARNFFDGVKPEFKRNQFGFTAGGPILRDHSFFFGSYEGLRDRLGLTQRNIVLTPEARRGVFPNRTLQINPAVRPYIELYPLPTPDGVNFGDGRAEFVRNVGVPTDENYFLVKVDQVLSGSDTIFARYNFDASTIVTQQPVPGFQSRGKTRRQFTTIEEKKVISPAVLNEFRFSFNRNIYGIGAEQVIKLDPGLSFVPGRPMGEIGVSGLASLGYSSRQDRFLTQNMFEYIDNVSYSTGGHSLRVGFQFKRIQFNSTSAFVQNGRWVFQTIDSFFQGRPFQLDVMVPGSDTIRGWRQNYFGAYVQDDLRLTSRLTLNLGLRYELTTEPWEVNGKVANLVNPLTDKAMSILDTLYNNPCRKCMSPRLGFAWDVFGNGRTALRGGFGLFHNMLLPVDWMYPATNVPPFFQRPLLTNPPFPSVPEALASVAIPPYGLHFIDSNPSQPYILKYNLNVQRQLLSDLVLTLGYSGSRTVHAGRQQNLNINQYQVLADGRKFFPVGAQRFNPVFSAYAYEVFDTQASYNAFQLSLNKRFSHGFQFQLSYTFSKTMDETSALSGSGEVSGTTVNTMDPYDHHRDYALAGFHVTNSAVINFSYDFPVKASGPLDKIVGGWQINGIVTMADGSPANISSSVDQSRSANATATQGIADRPNLKPGGNSNPFRDRDPINYWDGSQFQLQDSGFYGNLGRNTGIIPGVANLDLSLLKAVTLDEHRAVQFRAEFFNILNRANFGSPSGTVFQNNTGVPSATFGRIASTNTTSRQVQLALKFLF